MRRAAHEDVDRLLVQGGEAPHALDRGEELERDPARSEVVDLVRSIPVGGERGIVLHDCDGRVVYFSQQELGVGDRAIRVNDPAWDPLLPEDGLNPPPVLVIAAADCTRGYPQLLLFLLPEVDRPWV